MGFERIGGMARPWRRPALAISRMDVGETRARFVGTWRYEGRRMTRNLDEERVAALEADKRLLDQILEIARKSALTKEDQDRMDFLSAERDRLHATEAWKRVLAERK